MAKKKSAKPSRSKPARVAAPAAAPPAAESVARLAGQVQSLLTQRDSLAKQLAEEIAATEKKLAELKRSAAQLNPQKLAVIKERKVAKPAKAAKPGKKRGKPAKAAADAPTTASLFDTQESAADES